MLLICADASLILCVMDVNEANHETQAQSILGMNNLRTKKYGKSIIK